MRRFRFVLQTALRWLWRNWKSGELALLSLSLVVAVAIVTTITLFADRIERAFIGGSSVFLAADRLISGTSPIPDEWLVKAEDGGLLTASTLAFPSMAVSSGQQQLVAVKAVSEGYPLKGSLRIAEMPFTFGRTTSDLPQPGDIWLDSRLFPSLGVDVGDSLEIGLSRFRITQALISEPDRGGDVFGLGPRVLMRLSDVPATGLIQPGSRVNYRVLLRGSDADLDNFHQWLKPTLAQTAFRWIDIKTASPAIRSALERSESFLLLGGLLGVALSALAIGLAAHRYSERHFGQVAILKTLGQTPAQILTLYLAHLLMLGTLAIALGLAAGWLVQQGILGIFSGWLAIQLPAAGFSAFGVGLLTGLVCLFAFAVPPILGLREVTPMRVLRRDITKANADVRFAYTTGIAGLLGLLFWYSRDLLLAAWLLSGLLVAWLILALLMRGLFSLRRKLGMGAYSAWRLAIVGIQRRKRSSSLQAFAFSVVLLLPLLLLLVRTDLITDWRAQIPDLAANHFLINVKPDERQAVGHLLKAQGISGYQFFPSLRGRMTHISGEPVGERQARHAEYFEGGLSAEDGRNLTWSAELPFDNHLLAGRWWPSSPSSPEISLEEEIASILQAQIGEIVRFQIADRTIEARLTSIRKVRWDNFRPNFYIIFSPGVLEEIPGTWMTSFYLPQTQKRFLNRLLSQFPTLTVIEIDALIAQVQLIIEQMVLAVELMLVLVLIAGVFALIASLQSSFDQRRREYATLFALGAPQSLLWQSTLLEFGVLGLCAGLLAAIGTETSAFFLWRDVFLLAPGWHAVFWLVGPVAGCLLVGLVGTATLRPLLNTPPVLVFREG